MARGLFVHGSNRLEELLEALATVIGSEPLPPLADDVVLVPSQGIARWLRLRLAERFGIAASLQLPFLGSFFASLHGARGTGDTLAKDSLALWFWRILRDPASAREFAPAIDYCRDDPDDHKRFLLCQRLARAFDDYQIYRPDLLRRWSAGDDTKEQGPHAAWQARLWRRLLLETGLAAPPPPPPKAPRQASLFEGPPPPATPTATAAIHLAHLQERLADAATARSLLPPRLSVFGANTLPPAFLELLARCSHHVPVHVFVPEPAAFADAESDNPWLASFGQEAREFATALAQLDDTAQRRVHRFDLAALAQRRPQQPAASVLQHLQQEIADLSPAQARARPHRLAADDASFRVHDCHSRQRELEVVRDQILAAFAADATLQPHDVFVLVPDIEAYASLAHAVFGPVAAHLPFHVADRSPVRELPICSTLFAILQLAVGRVEVHEVFRILEEPAVHRRFGLFAGDLPMLRERCARAGIRWGIDGEARARSCRIPPFDDNAWRPGLERLLVGVATGPGDDLVLGVLPCADATSSRDEALARFVAFTDTLFAQLEPLARPQPIEDAAARLDELLAALFLPQTADDEQALARVRAATARLRELAARTGLRDAWSPTVLREWLEQALQPTTTARGFFAGAVTVAALTPMRTVPARCIFVCGLDDASFPRRGTPVAFDLIASQRRPGDRDARLDDRQLFLDVLLAARDQLHLCFVGHSQKDDSECAPSVLLAELLDHVDRCCTAADGDGPARRQLVVRHPLQPWSDRYRSGADPRLFTYGHGRTAERGPRHDEAPWCTGPVTPPADLAGDDLPLDRLLEFWKAPPRFFLRHVVRVQVRDEDDVDDPTEPFRLNPLARWRVQDQIVRLDGRTPAQRLALVRATGLLPVYGHGEALFAELDDETQAFRAAVAAHGSQRRTQVRATVDGVVVSGELDGLAAACIVRARMSKLKTKDRLAAWIAHVVAAVARHAGDASLPERTLVLGKDGGRRFRPLDAEPARLMLQLLIAGYRTGLREPLPFFHTTSEAFAEQRDPAQALDRARKAWRSDQPNPDRPPTDSEDTANQLCFRNRDPLALDTFARWANATFQALGACEEPL